MRLTKARSDDIDAIAPLFDAYRQFYEQASDLNLAQKYVTERLAQDEATIFLCRDDDQTPLGFTLLYPTFCSVAASKVYVLYDLYVAKAARRRGVATALMSRAQSFAMEQGAAWLKLETAIDNAPGQALYEKMGWERDEAFYTYHYSSDT